jgi:hypothetical protein
MKIDLKKEEDTFKQEYNSCTISCFFSIARENCSLTSCKIEEKSVKVKNVVSYTVCTVSFISLNADV